MDDGMDGWMDGWCVTWLLVHSGCERCAICSQRDWFYVTTLLEKKGRESNWLTSSFGDVCFTQQNGSQYVIGLIVAMWSPSFRFGRLHVRLLLSHMIWEQKKEGENKNGGDGKGQDFTQNTQNLFKKPLPFRPDQKWRPIIIKNYLTFFNFKKKKFLLLTGRVWQKKEKGGKRKREIKKDNQVFCGQNLWSIFHTKKNKLKKRKKKRLVSKLNP